MGCLLIMINIINININHPNPNGAIAGAVGWAAAMMMLLPG